MSNHVLEIIVTNDPKDDIKFGCRRCKIEYDNEEEFNNSLCYAS